MTDTNWADLHGQVVAELVRLRKSGLPGLRRLRPPRLTDIAIQADLSSSGQFEPSAVEDLLRRAVDHLGGGTEQDAAEYMFGLAQGWKMRTEGDRRKQAAATYGIQPDSFRKAPERSLIGELAEGVLAVAREADLRRTRSDLEQQRHPADSRLAVQWVERFEAYYRIWTPAWALAGDLLAAVATYREPPSPFPPWDPDGQEPASHEKKPDANGNRYEPADQANGYARYALYRYATYQLELKRFMSRYGGLWLLSDQETEAKVVDAVYRIGWHNPMNEEDDAWLRRNLADSRHEEQDHFNQVVRRTSTGAAILAEWQDYVAGCACQVDDLGELADKPKEGNVPACQVHVAIQACQDYCRLVDEDWVKVADWYRPGSQPNRGIQAGELYDQRRRRLRTE
jgi:hypothetical protein